MDDVLAHKKRRHDGHYQSNDGYHPRYKKHMGGQREDWRPAGPNFREKDNRYIDRQERGRNGNQFRDNTDTMWDVEINLIGQKDPNPMIHLCDTCRLPIRSYGRLIPCKHVFCFKCAKKTDKNCPRCGDEVHRIEQCRHGTVWMCSVSNCSRTYLSQRDLQAHVNHRHSKPPPPPTLPTISVPPPQMPGAILVPPPPVSSIPQLANPGQVAPYVLVPNVSVNQPPPTINMPVQGDAAQGMDMMARPSSNLITIQIQDDQQNVSYGQAVSQPQATTLFGTTPTTASMQNNQARSNAGNNQWPPQSRSARSQNRSNY